MTDTWCPVLCSIGIFATWISHNIKGVINIFVGENSQLIWLLTPCFSTNTLAAFGLNQSYTFNSWSHDAMISGCLCTLNPLVNVWVHQALFWSLILGKLHGSVFLLSSIWALNGVRSLWLVICYKFIIFDIFQFLCQWNTGLVLWLCFAIDLLPQCWVSLHGSRMLQIAHDANIFLHWWST